MPAEIFIGIALNINIYISSEKINLLKIFSLPIHVCGISHFFECPSLSLINVL